MTKEPLLFALMCLTLLVLVPATSADDSESAGDEAKACELMGELEALEAECEGRTQHGWALGHRENDSPKCRLNADLVFWTANDWMLLAQELAARQGECVHYYISIPPTANDKKLLRFLQDDVIRGFGPRFIPVAEMTLGTSTGWAAWVAAVPGRTWRDAGIEMRKRMVAAGYDFSRGETWLLNEADRSTRRDELPYTRQAIRDVVRGLALGDGTGPVVPGIVELGIQYSHQTMPDLTEFNAGTKSLLADSAFWEDLNPYVGFFAREAYADARRWGVAGSSLPQRAEHLSDYFHHLFNLAEDGPDEIEAARRFLRRTFMPFGNATWPARAPESIPLSATCPDVYICGHGSTMMPLDQMLSFVSEEVYAMRRFGGKHRELGMADQLGFSWQPTRNLEMSDAEWDASKRAVAARIAEAVRDGYGTHDASPNGACGAAGTEENWCTGVDVPGAFFTDAWADISSWDDD
jgi:hypothetical protein